MPLTYEQRRRLVAALRWSRKNGWKQGAWNRTWHNDTHWIGYDSETGILFIDGTLKASPDVRCRRAKVHVRSVDQALDVLAALGLLHPDLSPLIAHSIAEVVEPSSGVPDSYDGGEFDGPASFEQAGQALADLVDGRISADLAAVALSRLARQGLIASIEYLEEATSGDAPALDLSDVVPDPTERDHPPDLADLAMVLSTGHYVPLDATRDY